MMECLLLPNSGFQEDTGNVLFLLDTATGTDLMGSTPTVQYASAAAIDPSYLIDNVATVNFPSTSAAMTVTFQTPLNLQGRDWTLEWSSINTNNPTGYGWEIGLASTTAGIGVWARWGDAGYVNRLHFGTSFAAANNTWGIPLNKAAAQNTLSHFAMSCKDGQIRVFRNGTLLPLARGVGSTYDNPSFPPLDNISNLTRLVLGWQNSSNPAMVGHHGRVRISDFARYTRSYTHVPF